MFGVVFLQHWGGTVIQLTGLARQNSLNTGEYIFPYRPDELCENNYAENVAWGQRLDETLSKVICIPRAFLPEIRIHSPSD